MPLIFFTTMFSISFYIVNQADTPHDIGLRAFRDHVAAYVDITFCDSVIKFQGRYPVTDQLIRVDANLESFLPLLRS